MCLFLRSFQNVASVCWSGTTPPVQRSCSPYPLYLLDLRRDREVHVHLLPPKPPRPPAHHHLRPLIPLTPPSPAPSSAPAVPGPPTPAPLFHSADAPTPSSLPYTISVCVFPALRRCLLRRGKDPTRTTTDSSLRGVNSYDRLLCDLRMDVACFQLDGNADAVEFCPHYPFQQILAAATYTLQEGGQPDRSGSISLFSVEDDVGVELIHRVETVGIFDIKWNPYGTNADPLLALADAHGCLSVHSLKPSQDPETHGAILGEVCKEKVSPSMCLCLDWNPSATRISVGLSDGSMSVVSIGDAKLQISESWEAHGYEVWAASFDTHQPQLLYTGSDDCCFSCWDLRESPAKAVFQNTKSHKMGVCCIAKSPSNSNMLLTGSYDEFLRVWDVRATSRPLNESSICVGGGVWRIKHHPDIPGLVLAACMHNGFAVVKITEEGITVVEKYQKHESLAYGADWKKGGLFKTDGTRRGSLVATCSFYDKLLRIWLPESLLLG